MTQHITWPEPSNGPADPGIAHILMSRLFAIYLREAGNLSIRRAGADADLPRDVRAGLRAQGTPIRIALDATGTVVIAVLRRISASGHHDFGHEVWACRGPGLPYEPVAGPVALAELLLADVAARQPELPKREARCREIVDEIARSMELTLRYAEHRRRAPTGEARLHAQGDAPTGQGGMDDFVRNEQALIFGHPFHPTPKLADGISAAELAHFMPEMGASFRLHYLAVAPAHALDRAVTSSEALVPAAIAAQAQERLGPARAHWTLLPCHPWQARYLLEQRLVRTLLEAGELIYLEALGAPAHPTSSVRTVYLPDHDRFYKLPLDVRITNFVRTNPLEHLERSLAASRLIARVKPEIPERRFTVVCELGYRALQPQVADQAARTALTASSAVIFRQGIATGSLAPLVVASLLEPQPHGEPVLVQALRQAARTSGRQLTSELVCAWMDRYLAISAVPLLWLFVHQGISLEAHVQNSLVAFEAGWPARFYVRDLEGTTVSRERGARQSWWAPDDMERCALATDEATAWLRWKYYVVVNHLAHLSAVLASHTPVEEWQVWQLVRTAFTSAHVLDSADPCIDDLLHSASLPAKANLLSRLHGRGERPLYVSIPNPMRPEVIR